MINPGSIRAQWDVDAQVWVASSEEVTGLVTEAGTIQTLVEKLRALMPQTNPWLAHGAHIQITPDEEGITAWNSRFLSTRPNR